MRNVGPILIYCGGHLSRTLLRVCACVCAIMIDSLQLVIPHCNAFVVRQRIKTCIVNGAISVPSHFSSIDPQIAPT